MADYFKRRNEARNAVYDHIKTAYGATEASIDYAGEVVLVHPVTDPGKAWRKEGNEGYVPRRNTKEGKAVTAELEALPAVSVMEFINIIGHPYRDFDLYVGRMVGHGIFPCGTILIETPQQRGLCPRARND